MRVLFQPDQDEMIVNAKNHAIHIHLHNQTGDVYTVALDEEMANFLVRHLLEHLWVLNNAPELASLRQESIPF